MSRILTGQINRPVVKMPTFSFFHHEKACVKKAINQKKDVDLTHDLYFHRCEEIIYPSWHTHCLN